MVALGAYFAEAKARVITPSVSRVPKCRPLRIRPNRTCSRQALAPRSCSSTGFEATPASSRALSAEPNRGMRFNELYLLVDWRDRGYRSGSELPGSALKPSSGALATRPSGLPPNLQAPSSFPHVLLRPTVRKADEAIASIVIEIHTRRRRYAGLGEHPRAESNAVIAALADIGKQIKCPLGWRQPGEPCLRQSAQQVLP